MALTQQEHQAWQDALNGGQGFSGSPRDFLRAGDSVLVRLKDHIRPEDELHLFEQIDRSTGQQYNAKDLTWSYAEVLNALVMRRSAVAQLPPAEGRPVAQSQTVVV